MVQSVGEVCLTVCGEANTCPRVTVARPILPPPRPSLVCGSDIPLATQLRRLATLWGTPEVAEFTEFAIGVLKDVEYPPVTAQPTTAVECVEEAVKQSNLHPQLKTALLAKPFIRSVKGLCFRLHVNRSTAERWWRTTTGSNARLRDAVDALTFAGIIDSGATSAPQTTVDFRTRNRISVRLGFTSIKQFQLRHFRIVCHALLGNGGER